MGSHNSTAQGERMLARGGRKLAQSEPVEPSARGLSRGTLLCQLQRAYQEFLCRGREADRGHPNMMGEGNPAESPLYNEAAWLQRLAGGHMLKKLGRITRSARNGDDENAPPGQFVTEKFPVLTFGPIQSIDLDKWRFRIFGLVDEEVTLDWKQFMDLEKTTLGAEFHCVTQWSRLQNTWEGIAFTEVMKLVKPGLGASHVMVHCYGGYTTNMSLEVATDNDVLYAYKHDGAALEADHGGPLRLVVPKRYGWKSAKWVNGIEFMAKDAPGFWEVRGYHMEGDPWKEDRFSA